MIGVRPSQEQIALMKALNDYAPELLREAVPPTVLEIQFVEAKDGRPVDSADALPSDPVHDSGD